MIAKELRIGNYLFVPGIDREVIVSAIFKSHYVCEDSDGIRFDESVRINYQPISLTEEWLLKFGFIDLNERCGLKGIFSIIYKHIHINIETMSYCEIDYEENIIDIIRVEHVHQLQNLYFALTGEELTYGGNK
jgi:hypothetical protein